jgi:hypothetical protein
VSIKIVKLTLDENALDRNKKYRLEMLTVINENCIMLGEKQC